MNFFCCRCMAPPVHINTVPGKRLYFIFLLKIKFQPVDNRRKSYLEISMSFLHRRQNKLLVSTRTGDNSELFSFSLGHRMCTVLIQYRFYVPLIAQLLYYTKKEHIYIFWQFYLYHTRFHINTNFVLLVVLLIMLQCLQSTAMF